MEPEDLFLCSQNPVTLPYSVTGKSDKHYDKSFLILPSQPWSSKDTLASCLPTKTSYTSILSVVRVYAPWGYHPPWFDHPSIPWCESQPGWNVLCDLRPDAEETVEHWLYCLQGERWGWRNSWALTALSARWEMRLKKQLSIDCIVCKMRDEAEETVEHWLHCLQGKKWGRRKSWPSSVPYNVAEPDNRIPMQVCFKNKEMTNEGGRGVEQG